MHSHVYKLLELTGTSTTSIEDAVEKAIERAHNESKPMIIEFDTYRYYGHSVADSKHKGGYRPEEEIEKYKTQHDPIQLFKRRLIEERVLTEEQYEQIDAKLRTVTGTVPAGTTAMA